MNGHGSVWVCECLDAESETWIPYVAMIAVEEPEWSLEENERVVRYERSTNQSRRVVEEVSL